nr:MAG TPA: hypothetical protein [Caudoviricetes sp.]
MDVRYSLFSLLNILHNINGEYTNYGILPIFCVLRIILF